MNLLAPVDQYCERLGPGLLAEPLNAASNLAFIGASIWLLWRWRGDASIPRYARVLAALIGVIGLSSLAFHTFAQVWAEILDVASIGLFIYFFVICFWPHFFHSPWPLAMLAVPGFWLFGKLVTAPFASDALNGSVSYLPALAALLLMTGLLARRNAAAAKALGGAAVIFLVSLVLRTFDQAWCPSWPSGTHWLWHCLNAMTLTLVTLSLTLGSTIPPVRTNPEP